MTQRALCHVLAERRILLSKANLQALLLVNEDLQVTAAGLDMKSVEQLSHSDRYRTLKKLTAEEATLRANYTEDEAALADDTAEEYHQTYLSNASSAYQLNPEAVKRDTEIVEERVREEYKAPRLQVHLLPGSWRTGPASTCLTSTTLARLSTPASTAMPCCTRTS